MGGVPAQSCEMQSQLWPHSQPSANGAPGQHGRARGDCRTKGGPRAGAGALDGFLDAIQTPLLGLRDLQHEPSIVAHVRGTHVLGLGSNHGVRSLRRCCDSGDRARDQALLRLILVGVLQRVLLANFAVHALPPVARRGNDHGRASHRHFGSTHGSP